MAFTISEECTACGECAGNCPAGAIAGDKKGYAIDAEKCTECGACAEICPISAAKKC
ncbi:MAG: ferredoxin [Firmicutes bacterium HGW-Firmicutes-14]|jgi:ferredoxin|nr:MAG: ferredoxin [Firmicutes bacterium HGW-Firmicutes-14]